MKAGRLARGKANYDSKKFMKNAETLEYIESIKPEVKKNGKSNTRRTLSK